MTTCEKRSSFAVQALRRANAQTNASDSRRLRLKTPEAMMVIDDIRTRTRAELERAGLSVDAASYLVDDRPPGGWDSLVTRDQLRAELADVRFEISQQLSQLGTELREEMREMTRWVATTIIAALSASIVVTAIIGAALRLA
jgi:hypothetical protein